MPTLRASAAYKPQALARGGIVFKSCSIRSWSSRMPLQALAVQQRIMENSQELRWLPRFMVRGLLNAYLGRRPPQSGGLCMFLFLTRPHLDKQLKTKPEAYTCSALVLRSCQIFPADLARQPGQSCTMCAICGGYSSCNQPHQLHM